MSRTTQPQIAASNTAKGKVARRWLVTVLAAVASIGWLPAPGQAAPSTTDFTLSVAPRTLTLNAGESRDVVLKIVRGKRFKEAVTFLARSSSKSVRASVTSKGTSEAIATLTIPADTISSSESVTLIAQSRSKRKEVTVRIAITGQSATTTAAKQIPPSTVAVTTEPVTEVALPPKVFIMDATFSFPQVGPGGTAIANVVLEAGAETAAVALIPMSQVKSSVQTARVGGKLTFEVTFNDLPAQNFLVGFRAQIGSSTTEAFAPINLSPKPMLVFDRISLWTNTRGEIRSVFRYTEISGIPRPEYVVDGLPSGLYGLVHKGECDTSAYPTVCKETLIVTVSVAPRDPGTYSGSLLAKTNAGEFRSSFPIQVLK